ncbi:MAG: CoA activase, partial [Candidatus Tectomicrobia bacterium]|nr:CoA activase [Candidatus Tectomicrobia bacterium]
MSAKPKWESGSLYLGIDIGSVSVKVVVITEAVELLEERYLRSRGQPLRAVGQLLEEVGTRIPREAITGVGVTGSGGKLLDSRLPVHSSNEIIAQVKACGGLLPEVRTLIEMGGEDSKLIQLTPDVLLGTLVLQDFAMNTICAAGTGSFLDQQATRLGLRIEEEFGALALQSEHPPRIAGRCTVFAKSDMIHLQQIGTPLADIVAGLCYAVARNFKSALVKGKRLELPVAFLGGVAANAGMVRAFREVLELSAEELFVPAHHASMGAMGAALLAREEIHAGHGANPELSLTGLMEDLRALGLSPEAADAAGPRHTAVRPPAGAASRGYAERGAQVVHSRLQAGGQKIEAYLGIDVGSV